MNWNLTLTTLFFLVPLLGHSQPEFPPNQVLPTIRSNPVQLNPEWAPFYHGVASGDPKEDRVTLWTKVTPDSTMTGIVDVEWQIATDPLLENILFSGTAEAKPDQDYTLKVNISGLQPGNTYYYGFSALGKNSLTGKTKTTPVGNVVEHLKFGVINCANFQTGYFNSYYQLSQKTDLDAILFLGDFFYEYRNGQVSNPDLLADRPIEPEHEVITLEDYRMRYSTYHLDTMVIRLLQQHPIISVWDDHEFANNAWTGGATNHDEATEGDWEDRKAAAIQAFFEWTPIEDNPENNIYRTFRYGDLVELIMLDTRIVGRNEPFSSILDPGIQAPDRTILGPEQKAWFFDHLLNSNAKWKIIGNQVAFSKFSMGWLTLLSPGQSFYEFESLFLDTWKGFPAEQQAILDFMKDNALDNIVFVSGDIHTAFAQDVPNNPNEVMLVDTNGMNMVPLYLPSNDYDPQTGDGSLAVEMVVQSVTSPNFDEIFDPLSAAIIQALINSDLEIAGGDINLGNPNPHLKYADLSQHGYFILDVKPDSVQGNWFYTPILVPSENQTFGQAWYSLDGENRLRNSPTASPLKDIQDTPAPPDPPAVVGVDYPGEKSIPFAILGVYPNPFEHSQTLLYGLTLRSDVEINLVNSNGQVIRKLIKQDQSPGVYELRFNGADLPPGNYYYQLRGGDFTKAVQVRRQ